MCFEGSEDKQTAVDFMNKNYDTHVLQLLNATSWTFQNFDYLVTAINNIKKRVTGPESTLLLNTLFNRQYFKISMDKTRPIIEDLWGAVLYRKNEETFNFCQYKHIMRDYIRNDVKKALGITFKEYLNLTTYEKCMVDEFCSEWSQELAKSIQEAEKQSDKKINDIRSNTNAAIKQIQSANGIDEIFDV